MYDKEQREHPSIHLLLYSTEESHSGMDRMGTSLVFLGVLIFYISKRY